MTASVDRRAFIGQLTVAMPLVAVATPALSALVAAGPDDGISRTAESIHQLVTFSASPARVYDALVVPEQFAKATGQAAQINGEPGGAFSLFGGLIVGRQVELVPARRIVQGWRVAAWPAGVYSIARFELVAGGSGTRLEFDHTGFPTGAADHLASGWKQNYWGPLTKYLS